MAPDRIERRNRRALSSDHGRTERPLRARTIAIKPCRMLSPIDGHAHTISSSSSAQTAIFLMGNSRFSLFAYPAASELFEFVGQPSRLVVCETTRSPAGLPQQRSAKLRDQTVAAVARLTLASGRTAPISTRSGLVCDDSELTADNASWPFSQEEFALGVPLRRNSNSP